MRICQAALSVPAQQPPKSRKLQTPQPVGRRHLGKQRPPLRARALQPLDKPTRLTRVAQQPLQVTKKVRLSRREPRIVL